MAFEESTLPNLFRKRCPFVGCGAKGRTRPLGYGGCIYIGASHLYLPSLSSYLNTKIPLMTYQSSPVSIENVATDSLSSTNLAEAPEHDTDQRCIHQVNGPSPAAENGQNSALPGLPKDINTAFQTLQNHVYSLQPRPGSEAEIASLSEVLDSMRERALKLCQDVPAANDPQTSSESFQKSTSETSPEHFTLYNDAGADADDDSSEDSYTLVDPSHEMISHSYSRESDNKENESFDTTALPDWACTVTAGGCRVPLFWEGGDMGYFEYNQEQMKGDQGIC